MKISLALVAASALAAITAPALAQADVGFPGAVILCREAVPTRTLLSIETRIRNGIWVYEGDLYNATATLKSTPRINAATGAVIRIDNDTAAADETAQAQAILARLGEAQLDFADAIGFANGAAGHFDVERVKFEIEAGILAFRVEYFDGSTYDIDAATGGVIPHHGADDDMEATLPTTAVLPAISAAETAAGAGWKTIGLETEAEKGGNLVEVLLLNPNTGMLGLATVVGAEVSSFVQFAPAGGQVGQAARIITALPLIQVSASGAVSAAEAAYPGAGINEVELSVETEKTGTTVSWKISLITADLIELDYFVDATSPIGGGFRFATAPVNYADGDLDRDGRVDSADLGQILSAWGIVNPVLDLDGSGFVDSGDLGVILSGWSQN
jgi:uncharacterized membrane protein YkoI